MNLKTTPYSRLIYSAEHAKCIADGMQQEADKLEAQLDTLRADIPLWRAKADDFLAAAERIKGVSA